MTQISDEDVQRAIDAYCATSSDNMRDMMRNALQSLRSKPVAGVEVKPLEWKDGWGCSTAKSCVGVYQVKSRPSDSAVDVTLANGASVWSTWASVAEAAKAAAEADYRQRILSALLPKATAPVVSEPVAWQIVLPNGHEGSIFTDRETADGVASGFKTAIVRPLYASPQPQPKAVTEEGVERAAAAMRALYSNIKPNYFDQLARAALEAFVKGQ